MEICLQSFKMVDALRNNVAEVTGMVCNSHILHDIYAIPMSRDSYLLLHYYGTWQGGNHISLDLAYHLGHILDISCSLISQKMRLQDHIIDLQPCS